MNEKTSSTVCIGSGSRRGAYGRLVEQDEEGGVKVRLHSGEVWEGTLEDLIPVYEPGHTLDEERS